MRLGNNPLRRAECAGYEPVIISAIVHLPDTAHDYHRERMKVIRTSLITMRERAGVQDAAIAIWDNGSCKELRDWLQEEYKPDYLMLSRNVGKSNARAALINMFPDNSIFALADDDMYYYQDWLKAQMELLYLFPSVGQVSGYPVRTQMRWGNRHTILWAKQNAMIEAGKYIPERWEQDFCTSIGRGYEWHARNTIPDMDLRITYKGVQAYAFAHHCQWVGIAGRIKPFCKYDNAALADEKPFDCSIDDAGLLRLCTTDRYVRHIGNHLDPDMEEL